MYIEQGYEGNFSLWKFWILPLGFIGFMIYELHFSPLFARTCGGYDGRSD